MTPTQNLAKLRETLDLIDRTTDPRARVALASSLEVTARWQIRTEVEAWRAQGGSWADVGDVLGTSRQSAHERFSR